MSLISSYMKARDHARLESHKEQMRERKTHFLNLLHEKEDTLTNNNNAEEAHHSHSDDSMFVLFKTREERRKLERIVQQFSCKYKKKIGAHPFIAGLQKLLKTQILNEDRYAVWSFDIATLTENCSMDDAIMLDSINLLLSLLSRYATNDDDEEKKEDGVSDSSSSIIIDWVVRDSLSIMLMKRILRLLPHASDLDAKPTGNICLSKESRTTGSAEGNGNCLSLVKWCFIL